MDWEFLKALAIIEGIMFAILMAVGLSVWAIASLIYGAPL